MSDSQPILNSMTTQEPPKDHPQKIDTTATLKAIKKPDVKPEDELLKAIRLMAPQIKLALPKGFSEDRFLRIALTSLRTNQKLLAVAVKNQLSFLAALMQSVQLGLEPNTPLGEAYLIPYGDEVQFQVGYQGIINLAYRTDEYKSIYAFKVHKGDDFKYSLGLDMTLHHIPAEVQSDEVTHYYGVYKRKDGGYGFYVASKGQIDAHAKKYSQSLKNDTRGTSVWKKNFDGMALKTVLKSAMKYAQKSIELSKAFAADETFKRDLDEDMLNVQSFYDEDVLQVDQEEKK